MLNGFARLFSLLAEKPFAVENPFIWKTKTDVVNDLAKADCADLIPYATSCTHTWEMTNLHTHCGMCSQCIDRRFAVLSSGCGDSDPAEAYKIDLLVGAVNDNSKGDPRTMLSAYVETANEVSEMTPLQFFGRFGEAGRVLRHINGSPDTVAMQVYELHKRHAMQVVKVIKDSISTHATDILKRRLPNNCLLRLVCDASALASPPSNDQAPSDTPQSPNYIWKKGQCWAIRFEGNEEKIYTPETGFYYLQMLLDNAGTSFSASELDCAVSRKTKERIRASVSGGEDFSEYGITVLGTSHGGEILDKDAIQSYKLRIEEIDEEVEQAKANNDLARIHSLESEKEWIIDELNNACGLGGRIRTILDDRNRVRNRVCNAIRRALNKIAQYDRPLSEHLAKPVLNLGHTISYVPRDGLSWSVAPSRSD